jgi:3',5'-cyclic AMP phosphodiesterase CpdA
MNCLPTLRFGSDHRFKIVQFTDIHWKDGSPDELRLFAMMEAILDREKPDLAVLTGDIVHSPTRTLEGCVKVAEPIIARGIPWAPILGNHDHEGDASRDDIATCLESLPLSLMQRGPAELGGHGNYGLDVMHSDSNQPAARLYFLDSGTYSPLKARGVRGYAWIAREQIRWFESASCGRDIPSLVFLHIPLPEYLAAWEKGDVVGQKNETICAPELNSGFFAALVESGGVLGTFAGHDHDNDFAASLHGISLCYGRSLGLDTYGNLPRGARVIELTQGAADFASWIREETGADAGRFMHSALAPSTCGDKPPQNAASPHRRISHDLARLQ